MRVSTWSGSRKEAARRKRPAEILRSGVTRTTLPARSYKPGTRRPPCGSTKPLNAGTRRRMSRGLTQATCDGSHCTPRKERSIFSAWEEAGREGGGGREEAGREVAAREV